MGVEKRILGRVGKENGEAEEINTLNSFMFRIAYHTVW